uniref:Uncharacterized protein n=1 Tax=Corvus moneduloides TaxID=1196302 RepID=A0A8C3D799_CORMO
PCEQIKRGELKLFGAVEPSRASPVLSEELVAQHFGVRVVLSPGGGGPLQVPGCAGGLCASGTPFRLSPSPRREPGTRGSGHGVCRWPGWVTCVSKGILGMPLHPKSTCSWSGDGLSCERTSKITGAD